MVPGWDLITSVGPPLEAVVDSAETAGKENPPEDGAPHHSIKIYTGKKMHALTQEPLPQES